MALRVSVTTLNNMHRTQRRLAKTCREHGYKDYIEYSMATMQNDMKYLIEEARESLERAERAESRYITLTHLQNIPKSEAKTALKARRMLIRKYKNDIRKYDDQLETIGRDQVTLLLKQTVFELGYIPHIWEDLIIPDGLEEITDEFLPWTLNLP